MLSSMLLPKTQKKSALPSRCPQLPCRNIDVSGVSMLIGSRSTTQPSPGPIGTAMPSGADA